MDFSLENRKAVEVKERRKQRSKVSYLTMVSLHCPALADRRQCYPEINVVVLLLSVASLVSSSH